MSQYKKTDKLATSDEENASVDATSLIWSENIGACVDVASKKIDGKKKNVSKNNKASRTKVTKDLASQHLKSTNEKGHKKRTANVIEVSKKSEMVTKHKKKKNSAVSSPEKKQTQHPAW